MGVLILKNNRFFVLVSNLRSDSLGFYFSLIFHFIILLFAIGLPNFFEREPIRLPNIIPIEIINVTDTTSIPEKLEENKKKINKTLAQNKKFNNSNNQEVKKAEIKTTTNIKEKTSGKIKTPNEDIFLKENIKTPIKLEKEKKTAFNAKTESLPSKIIKPKIKPKPKINMITEQKIPEVIVKDQPNKTNVGIKKKPNKSDVIVRAQPKPKPEVQFSIASMLKDLRNEQSSQKNEKIEKKNKNENISDVKKEINEENLQLSISEIDLLRQQLSLCWIAPAGAVIEKGMIVKISAKLQKTKKIYDNSVRIVDTNISKTNPFYGPITESAMRTLLNPDCIPLKLPDTKYSLWKNLTITFDYSIMKGYE